MQEILNAKITNTQITMKEYGSLIFYLTLEGAGWGVSFGGYCIGHGYLGAHEFKAETGKGLEAMMQIMDVIGVETWEDLKGQYCRVEHNGLGTRVTKIGHLMKDRWFDIEEFFKANSEEEKVKKNV